MMERRDKLSIGEGLCAIIAGVIIFILFGLNYLYWTVTAIASILLGLYLVIYTMRTLDRGS
jgi:hypothetical protein